MSRILLITAVVASFLGPSLASARSQTPPLTHMDCFRQKLENDKRANAILGKLVERDSGKGLRPYGVEATPACEYKQKTVFKGDGPLHNEYCVLNNRSRSVYEACKRRVEGKATAPAARCGPAEDDGVADDPDRAFLEELKKGVGDEGLEKFIDSLLGAGGAPFVILKNAFKARSEATAKIALAHIRSVYQDDQRQIAFIGSPDQWTVEHSQALLRSVGGTLWSVDVPVSKDRIVKGLFYHPDADFSVKKHHSVHAMYQAECTADRPDGNQDVGPRLYPDHRRR